MAATPKAEIRVLEARPGRAEGLREHRWTVRAAVVQPLTDEFPTDLTDLTLIVHSPSRTFATPLEELPRYIFTVEFDEPVTDPYAGSLRVTDWRAAGDPADAPER